MHDLLNINRTSIGVHICPMLKKKMKKYMINMLLLTKHYSSGVCTEVRGMSVSTYQFEWKVVSDESCLCERDEN